MAGEHMELDGVTRQVAAFQVSDEETEDEDIVIPQTEIVSMNIDLRWAIVGRFLTERFIRKFEMSQIMAHNWHPGMGVYIHEVVPQLFVFQLAQEVDIRRVMEGGSLGV